MHTSRPTPASFNEHFSRYVSLVEENDVVSALDAQRISARTVFSELTEEEGGRTYAPGKWTIGEVLGHIIDCERVFGYRALWMARGGCFPLPTFDEKAFAKTAMHRNCLLGELVEEFDALRRSHILMFRHLSEEAWERLGVVEQHQTSALAWAFIMVGHLRHHAMILSDRYGIDIVA